MRKSFFGLALIQGLMTPTGSARSEVVETLSFRPYAVSGDTITQVRREMDRYRPQQHDALTTWHVTWRFEFRRKLGLCFIDTVNTKLDIVYILPELKTADPGVNRSFDAYWERLKLHEDGHARIGRIIARRIHTGMAALGPYASCLQLEQVANGLGHRLVREGAEMDEAYDAKTDHGATQGARWP